MKTEFSGSETYRRLRQMAEQRKGSGQTAPPADADFMRMINEIEVQQIELELQNEELRKASKDLELSRNDYFELFDSAPTPIVIVNTTGLIEKVNQAAARLLAGPVEHLIGRSFSTLVSPDYQQTYYSFLKRLALHKGDRSCELQLLGRDRSVMDVHFQAAAKADRNGRFAHWRFAIMDITQRKQFEHQLQRAQVELGQRNRQLARLTAELTLAEQRERRRLSDILHDHLQQLLAGARLHLDAASEAADGPARLQAVQDAGSLVEKSIQTSRTLSAELSPPVLYLHGLCEALKWLARWMETAHRLKVRVNVDPRADPAQEELKILLFQAVRELLFNAAKHSGADSAAVGMRLENGHIVFEVSDHGSGFDAREVFEKIGLNQSGYGLFNIRERVQLLGGAFDIVSSPGGGTNVRISVPKQVDAFERPQPPEETDRRAAVRPDADIHPSRPPHGKIRVLLVDDHTVMRKGLSSLLMRHGDIEIVGEAADGGQAVELARRVDPDVVIMDINMPIMNGVEATRIIHAQMPRVKIIALSMHAEQEQAGAMYQAGAVGFLSKGCQTDTILTTIRELGQR